MNERTALMLAQRWINTPYKNENTGEWIVEWLDRTIIKKETFLSCSDAYSFFYCKTSKLKNKIMNVNYGMVK